jgi:hypothetical protein
MRETSHPARGGYMKLTKARNYRLYGRSYVNAPTTKYFTAGGSQFEDAIRGTITAGQKSLSVRIALLAITSLRYLEARLLTDHLPPLGVASHPRYARYARYAAMSTDACDHDLPLSFVHFHHPFRDVIAKLVRKSSLIWARRMAMR